LDVTGAHFSWALDSSGAQFGLGLTGMGQVQIAIGLGLGVSIADWARNLSFELVFWAWRPKSENLQPTYFLFLFFFSFCLSFLAQPGPFLLGLVDFSTVASLLLFFDPCRPHLLQFFFSFYFVSSPLFRSSSL
jgi:hypothetical protein